MGIRLSRNTGFRFRLTADVTICNVRGMGHLTSYIPIFNKWPSLKAFADDIGIDPAYARTLKMRDSLPSSYWNHVEAAAKRRKLRGINIKTLADIAEAKVKAEDCGHETSGKKLIGKLVGNASLRNGQSQKGTVV